MKQFISMIIFACLVFSPSVLGAQESLAKAQQPQVVAESTLPRSDSSFESTVSLQDRSLAQQHQEVQQVQTYDSAPEAVRMSGPKYPEAAQQQKLEGTVWVKMWVNEEGNPDKISISKSDAEIFNQAAIDAATQWKFKPAILKGKPVGVWLAMPIRFRLPSSQPENINKPLEIKKSKNEEVISLPKNHTIRIWAENSWIHLERKNSNGELIWRIPLCKASSYGLPSISKQENTITIKDHTGRFFMKDEMGEIGFWSGTSLRVVRDPQGNTEKLQFKPSEYGLKYGGGMASSNSRNSAEWKANGWSYISTSMSSGGGLGLVVRMCFDDFAEDPGIHGTASGSFYATRGNYKFYDDGGFLYAERMGEQSVIQKLMLIQQLCSAEPPALSIKRWYNTGNKSLKDFSGKVLLLAFFDCRDPRAFGQLANLSYVSRLFEGKDLAVISVQSKSSEETVDRFLSKYPTQLPIALDDGSTGDAYKVLPQGMVNYEPAIMPAYFVIDKKGRMRKALLIGIPDKRYLEALLAE
jgi:TonB family protein